MSDRIRTAVVGVGHFGRYHAEKYSRLERSNLIAVCDTDSARAQEIAHKHGVAAVADHRELFGEVDAVSIVVPTKAHFEVARAFMERGVHVLVEKPITDHLADADRLVRLAEERDLVLQVGHLERFSPAMQVLEELVARPLYIESYRIAPFQVRGSDIGVILDLMIHDIDLILALVNASVESVDAVGTPVFSRVEDIVNTRVHFTNGCVANLTASRISDKYERKMRIFQHDSYISVDFFQHEITIARHCNDAAIPDGVPNVEIEKRKCEKNDSLLREIDEFLNAISSGSAPRVSGEDGRRALAAVIMITESLQRHLKSVQNRFGHAAIAPAPAGV